MKRIQVASQRRSLCPQEHHLHEADIEAIAHLKARLAEGEPWYVCLLEAIALWVSPCEERDGRHWCYLIGGEAFDWLLLAERLCQEVEGLIPQDEEEALLFHGSLPVELPADEFRRLIGIAKYRAHLNFLYGVIVEEALQLAVEEEFQKEVRAHVYRRREEEGDAFRRLYGASEPALLERFSEEIGRSPSDIISLEELRGFTYWLFKHRLRTCAKPRIASDTRKGLARLAQQQDVPWLRATSGGFRHEIEEGIIDLETAPSRASR